MSGSDSLELSETHAQIESLLGELQNAFEEVVVHDDDCYSIPPAFVCMAVCDDLRDLGPIAKSAIPQLLTILEMNVKSDDQHLLQLRAAHAHFAITGESGICLNVALRLLDVVSKEQFSDSSPSEYDGWFWLRAWACDILGEMGAAAFTAAERLKLLEDVDGCSKVRESARQAIRTIRDGHYSVEN